mgnify:CR=1 FL=1
MTSYPLSLSLLVDLCSFPLHFCYLLCSPAIYVLFVLLISHPFHHRCCLQKIKNDALKKPKLEMSISKEKIIMKTPCRSNYQHNFN